MTSVLVHYSFVVEVEDPNDLGEVTQAVREYVQMTRDPLASPDSIEVLA